MRTILVDARNAMYRYGHVGRFLKSASGQHTGAIHGLLQGMLAIKRKYTDAKFIACWDGDGSRKSWRSDIFPAYKQNRNGEVTAEVKELRESVASQIDIAKKLFKIIDVAQMEIEFMEADDLIGCAAEGCRAKGWFPYAFSSDQDFYQLMAHGVKILKSAKDVVREQDVYEKFKCSPQDVLKIRALLGDKSDGIPRAIPGVGPVAAARYIAAGIDPSVESFDDLPRSARQNAERLKEYWPVVRINYRLMKIVRDCADAELDKPTQKQLREALKDVIGALDRPVIRDQGKYGKMLSLFAEMELAVAVENRVELWNLQRLSERY